MMLQYKVGYPTGSSGLPCQNLSTRQNHNIKTLLPILHSVKKYLAKICGFSKATSPVFNSLLLIKKTNLRSITRAMSTCLLKPPPHFVIIWNQYHHDNDEQINIICIKNRLYIEVVDRRDGIWDLIYPTRV